MAMDSPHGSDPRRPLRTNRASSVELRCDTARSEGRHLQRLATDPYRLDFLRLDPASTERQTETALVDRISEFLMHLGLGFAYLGRRFRLTVGDSDFFLDLLFCNTHLHAYVVFELKTQPFVAAHAGHLAFYVTAIEREIRTERDNPTIGVLLDPDKDQIVVEHTLASRRSARSARRPHDGAPRSSPTMTPARRTVRRKA